MDGVSDKINVNLGEGMGGNAALMAALASGVGRNNDGFGKR